MRRRHDQGAPPESSPLDQLQLRARRPGFTFSYSRFADGRIAEVFITNRKVVSAVDVDARYAAIIRLSGINQFLEQNTEPAGRLVRQKRGER